MGRKVEEKGLVLVLLDEISGARRQPLGYLVIFPKSSFSAGLEADPADTVDDSVIMAVSSV